MTLNSILVGNNNFHSKSPEQEFQTIMPAIKSTTIYPDSYEVMNLKDINEVKQLYADISKGYSDLSA